MILSSRVDLRLQMLSFTCIIVYQLCYISLHHIYCHIMKFVAILLNREVTLALQHMNLLVFLSNLGLGRVIKKLATDRSTLSL